MTLSLSATLTNHGGGSSLGHCLWRLPSSGKNHHTSFLWQRQLGCQHLAATPWLSSDCFGKGGKHPSSPLCPPLHGNHTARTVQRSLHELSGSEGPSHVSVPQTLLLSTSGQLFCWVVFGTLSYVVVLWFYCLSMFFITRYAFQSSPMWLYQHVQIIEVCCVFF